MIALRMIECWILGDKKAIEQYYGVEISNKGYTPKPEIIWGDEEDPSSNYPKNYLRRIIQNSDKRYQEHIPDQADFVEIASYADINTIIKKCPNSFAIFYQDFIMMLGRSKSCESGNNVRGYLL